VILNVTCPHCGALLDVDPAWLGQPMECGGCGSVFPCPEIAEEALPDAPKVVREMSSRRDRKRERDDYDRWDGYEEYNQEEDPDSHIAKKRGPGYATASLVIGIISIIIGSGFSLFCCGFVQTIMSVIGLILGYIGLRSDSRVNAIAGMVLNVLGAIFSVVYMSFMGVLLTTMPFGPAKAPPPPPSSTATWKSGIQQPPLPPPNKAKR